jgi:hypothetical protein
LEESAQITTGKLPNLTAKVRRLSGQRAEENLFHPEGAEETLGEAKCGNEAPAIV